MPDLPPAPGAAIALGFFSGGERCRATLQDRFARQWQKNGGRKMRSLFHLFAFALDRAAKTPEGWRTPKPGGATLVRGHFALVR